MARIEPGRTGFVVGAAIIVVGVVAGVVLLATGILSAIGTLPKFTTEFAPGAQQTVRIESSGTWSLYAGGNGATQASGDCVIRSPEGQEVSADTTTTALNFTRKSRQWYWLSNFTVTSTGTYQFECTGTNGIDRFAIGEKPNVSGFAGRLAGGIIAVAALPCIGFVTGLTLIIITAVRRASARTKLRQSAYPPGPVGYPGPGTQPPPYGGPY